MKRIPNFILFLTLFSIFLLSACGGRSSAEGGTPNADHLVDFDQQGIAVIRGHVSKAASSLTPNGSMSETLYIDVPVDVDGIESVVAVPLKVRNETIVSSSLTEQTDLLEFLSFHNSSSAYDAFPNYALVDITFRKNSAMFVAISIKEVKQGFSLFKSNPAIEPPFTMQGFSQGVLQGRIIQSYKNDAGVYLWTVATPIDMQGIQASLLLSVYSDVDTEIISASNTIMTLDNVRGNVEIQFTRDDNTLTAHQITERP